MSPGNKISLKNVTSHFTFNGATTQTGDIQRNVWGVWNSRGRNGVVHVIEAVLLPVSCGRTVVTFAEGDPRFSTLVSLLKTAELVTTLSNDEPNTGYTVFAPTNDAFQKIDKSVLDCLKLPSNKETLANLLKYHVVGSTVVAKDLINQAEIPSLAEGTSKYKFGSTGTTATLTPMDGTASTITETDLLATNGVVHVVDTVLIPKGLKCGGKDVVTSASSLVLSSSTAYFAIMTLTAAMAMFG